MTPASDAGLRQLFVGLAAASVSDAEVTKDLETSCEAPASTALLRWSGRSARSVLLVVYPVARSADLALSGPGQRGQHGHRYGSNVVDGLVALAAPDGWTEADTLELRQLIDTRSEERDAKTEVADG